MKSFDQHSTFLPNQNNTDLNSRVSKGLVAGFLIAASLIGHVDDTTHEVVFGTSIDNPGFSVDPLSLIDTPIHEAVDVVTDHIVPDLKQAAIKMLGDPLFKD